MHLMRSLSPPLTAARLARALEVSERTLYRDVESLRLAGARIEGEAGVGYTLTEDSALPPQTLSRLEIEALVIGLGEVRVMGDPALADAAQQALAKIVASLPEPRQREAMHAVSMVRQLRSDTPKSAGDLDTIRQACWDEQALDITYEDRHGQLSERRIYPLSIVYMEDRLIVLAWCVLRGDFRMFFPHKIGEATRADESFRPRRVALLRSYVETMRAQRVSGQKHMDAAIAKGRDTLKAKGITVPPSPSQDE